MPDIASLFASVVHRAPARPAVRLADRTLTYRELDELSAALAARITPGQVTAVTSENRGDYVVGLLAVLRAGGIYLPLDSEAPADRNAFVRADAGARAVLDGATFRALGTPGPHDAGRWAPPAVPAPDGGGYIIYTSGTTGRPKGVHVAASALAGHLEAARETFGLSDQDVVLHLARPHVDVAVEQVLTTLLAGATLVVPDRPLLAPAELLALLSGEQVTVANLSAGYFRDLVAALDGGAFPAPSGLRLMICGSDRLYPEVAAAWRARTGVPLVNAYGPTETVITSTTHLTVPDQDGGVTPIGRAVGERTLHVLDERLRPSAPGTAGELYIGGPLLASGYWGRGGQTAERFLPDPLSGRPGARMYRTGDLVRRAAPDAPLEFLGRADDQVKIRGFRVEPGEIEQVLATCPGVEQCVVAARDGRLVAYVTGRPPHADRLRQFLADRLPAPLVPALFVPVRAFTLTAAGKIDRAALPAPDAVRPAAEGPRRVPPRTPIEQLIAGVWSEVLGVPDIGADDNFFHLGGDSLTAVRVVARIFEVFGTVSPYTIFDAPTLAGFAAAVTAAGRHEPAPLTRSGRTRAPLSPFQRGLWVLDQWHPGSSTYNVPWVFRFDGPVDALVLRTALEVVAGRHEALRTTFGLGDDGPEQRVGAVAEVPFTVTEVPAGRLDAAVADLGSEPFDLERGPLLRAHLMTTSDGGPVLLLVVHHIVWDEGSLAVLEEELRETYAALAAGRPPTLPELPCQYADFSAWQAEHGGGAEQLGHWRRQLAGPRPGVPLPTDRPRPEEPRFRGAVHRFRFPAPVALAVKDLARAEDATPYMVLLAGLALTLHRRSGATDIVVGSPVSMRNRPELASLIGYFVNLLPIRVAVDPGLSFVDLVHRVRETAVDAYRHQDTPFDEITALAAGDGSGDGSPLCQVVLEMHPLSTEPLRIGDAEVARALHSNPVSRFDLSISVDDTGSGFTGRFEYDTDLFDAATMAEVCEQWQQTLAAALEVPVHRLFEERAGRTPSATALVHGDRGVTYGELNARANRLAHLLLGRNACGRGDVVAVLAERGPELVAALLAVLKTGAGYTLLDPEFPTARLAGAITDSQACLVLVHGLDAAFPGVPHLDLAAVDAEAAGLPDTDPTTRVTGADLACVMFTSGSTGRPKGVAAPHRALTTTYLAQDYARFGPDEVWLQASPVSWDAFALELFGALAFGGACVLHPGQRPDPETVARLTRQHGVTQLQLSGSLFSFLVEEFPETFTGLHTAFTAGERASVPHVAKALESFPGLRVGNGYGPVESMGFTTCRTVTAEDVAGPSVPVGAAVGGKDVVVLDRDLRPVADGESGEVYAAGGGLAYGYAGRPALTSARFVASPFRPGERMYRTGDLGRVADGVLSVIGRADDQVKIRGYRVEPGEIEDVLVRQPGVRQAVVAVHEPAPGDLRLAAYVTASEGHDVRPDALLCRLSDLLPDYLVPATLDVLDALPLNANGKADRAALPAPSRPATPRPAGGRGSAEGTAAAMTARERLVAEAVAAILGTEDIGPQDDFFRLGGNSLAAVRIAMRLSTATGTRVPPRLLFRARTVSAIAAALTPA
ncbi:non-ribosomal peptide synthetase [Actinacidiphila rubida]|uniref:Amino acid adenylation domain-containing protein n=1 Tax=Actinacidiphila rubida TaxID=310780 RepID=A0A1H8KBV2_9ACTN|nr:non-ribosomal peptide synthetase [Actinacidiphila rubida]SEN89888.1 amino acid adenylation domain-containing protein [Actinacidiphila rubida]